MKSKLLTIIPGILAGFIATWLFIVRRNPPEAHQSIHRDSALSRLGPVASPPIEEAQKGKADSLLARLVSALEQGNATSANELTTALISLGDPTVVAIRNYMLASSGSAESIRTTLWKPFSEILKALSGESTSLLLFDGFLLLDSQQEARLRPVDELALALFTKTIILRPNQLVIARAKSLFTSARRLVVKRYLIKLLGGLIWFDPGLRDLLATILRGDPQAECRAEAAEALGSVAAAESASDFIRSLKDMFGSSTPQSPPELMAVLRSLSKSMPLSEVLSVLGDSIDKAPARMNVILAGTQLGLSYVGQDISTLDDLYFKLAQPSSSNMQIMALSAINLSVQRGIDPRAFDAAMHTFDDSKNEEVRSLALNTAVEHAIDPSTVIQTVDNVLASDPKMTNSAAQALASYSLKHAESPAVFEKIVAYASEGPVERRLQFIQNLKATDPSKNPFRPILEQFVRSDPDQDIRAAAKDVLEFDPSKNVQRFGTR